MGSVLRRDFNHLTYLHLIDLALLIASKRPNVVQETRDTFAFMIAEVGGKERGPLLASLELEKQLAVRDEAEMESAQRGESRLERRTGSMTAGKLIVSDSCVTALPELIQAYFSTFSTKACCFEDVRPYLPTDQQAIDALRQELTPTMEKKPVSEPLVVNCCLTGRPMLIVVRRYTYQTSAKEVYTLINAHKIVRYLSEASSDNNAASLVQEELELATKLMEHHRNGLEYGQSYDSVTQALASRHDLVTQAFRFDRPRQRSRQDGAPTRRRPRHPCSKRARTSVASYQCVPPQLISLTRRGHLLIHFCPPRRRLISSVPGDRVPRARPAVVDPEPLLPSAAHPHVPHTRSVPAAP